MADAWRELERTCQQCRACGLADTRTTVVFGDGATDAEILLVGEGPGQREDEQGVPFVGPAGKLLDDMLEIIGLDRTKVYVANIVKCRPPRNRDPLNVEQDACIGWLRRQTALLRSPLPLKSRRPPPPVTTARWWCPLTKSANSSPNATKRRGRSLSRKRLPPPSRKAWTRARMSRPRRRLLPSAGAVLSRRNSRDMRRRRVSPAVAVSPRRPPRSRIPRLASPETKCPEGNGARLPRRRMPLEAVLPLVLPSLGRMSRPRI